MDVSMWARDARSADVKVTLEAGLNSTRLTHIMMGGFYSG